MHILYDLRHFAGNRNNIFFIYYQIKKHFFFVVNTNILLDKKALLKIIHTS